MGSHIRECSKCHVSQDIDNFYRKYDKFDPYRVEWHWVCKTCSKVKKTSYRQTTRNKAIKILGGCCVGCGYSFKSKTSEANIVAKRKDPSLPVGHERALAVTKDPAAAQMAYRLLCDDCLYYPSDSL